MADLQGSIAAAAQTYGVDPATLARIAQVESGGDANAANPNSSARGPFQFTSGTAKQYGLDDPTDPATSSDAAARLTRDNGKTLTAAGVEVNPGSLYLAHFAGAVAATKVLKADPSTPVGDVLGPAAVKANPFLARMTVGDLRGWAAGKMGGAASLPPRPPMPIPDQPGETTIPGMLGSVPPLPPAVNIASRPPIASAQPQASAPLDLASFQTAASGAAPQEAATGKENYGPIAGMLNGAQPQASPQFAQLRPIQLPPGLNRARLLASLLPSQRGNA